MLIKQLQSLPRRLSTRIHAVNLDVVTTARHMETPVPAVSDFHRLRVETVVPAANNELDPALVVTRHLARESTPGEFMLRGEVLDRYGIPYISTV